MIGRRFGRLRVEARSPNQGRQPAWQCICDCGKTKIASGSNLRRGLTQSCGCLHTEVTSVINRTHGKSRSKIYIAWRNMRARCADLSDSRYGGRGIRVCERWEKFENFLADLGEPPSPRHSLDRYPDQNGNYEPGNCRWATMSEQLRNNSSNRLVTFNGLSLPLIEHCERAGLDYKTVHQRLRRGWTVEKALTELSQAA
jgi:hypothetical protein